MDQKSNDPGASQEHGAPAASGAAARPGGLLADHLQALAEVSRAAGNLGVDANQAISCAVAAMCVNLAQSTGMMYQSGVTQHHQMMMTSHAAAMKGVIEMFRTRSPQPAMSPSEETLFNILFGSPPRPREGNGGNGSHR